MEAHILSTFSDEQVDAYNSVMENGDHASQLLIISFEFAAPCFGVEEQGFINNRCN